MSKRVTEVNKSSKNLYRSVCLKLCSIYLLLGLLWVYFSDRVLNILVINTDVRFDISTYKGWGFVVITTFVLYFLSMWLLRVIRRTEREIRKSEKKYRTLVEGMNLGMILFEGNLSEGDELPDFRVISINESYKRLRGLINENIIGLSFMDLIPGIEEQYVEELNHTMRTGEPSHYERYEESTNTYFEVLGYRPQRNQLAVIISDITQRKKVEEEMLYLSNHDQLTGLYNRRAFMDKLISLDTPDNYPLTIIFADINGLKLINDSFGHLAGDELIAKVSEIINKSSKGNDYKYRLSGDEFIILAPNTCSQEAEQIIKNMKELASKEKVGFIDVSISFGYEIKRESDVVITDVLKKAEDNMYRNKLFEGPGMREKTINLILTTLYEKNSREERHSRSVSELCEAMGIALDLSADRITELKNVGLLHDIGKIGIDEGVLNKTGRLSDEEQKEMKKHSEIGYRILSTVNDLSEIAEYILAHHERWDGTGYPKGLKGNEIPMQSRILTIADSYDSMVSDRRTYKDVLSKEEAGEELKRNAGTRFDPDYVKVFVEKVLFNL